MAVDVIAYERDGFVSPLTAFGEAEADAYRQALLHDCAEAERPAALRTAVSDAAAD